MTSAELNAPYARVFLFGKHPSSGEFVRSATRSDYVDQVDQWISSGLHASKQILPRWTDHFYDLAPTAFIQGTADSTHVLYGVIVPSTDKNGREFPLVVFSELEAAATRGKLRALPYDGFLAETIAVLQRRGEWHHYHIMQTVQQITPPNAQSLDTAYDQQQTYVHKTSARSVFEELFAKRDALYWSHAWNTVRDILAKSTRDVGIRYALRLPLGHHPTAHAALWLMLLDQSRSATGRLTVTWNRNGMLLHLGETIPRAFSGLLNAEWQDESIFDLRHQGVPTSLVSMNFDQPLDEFLGVQR